MPSSDTTLLPGCGDSCFSDTLAFEENNFLSDLTLMLILCFEII